MLMPARLKHVGRRQTTDDGRRTVQQKANWEGQEFWPTQVVRPHAGLDRW